MGFLLLKGRLKWPKWTKIADKISGRLGRANPLMANYLSWFGKLLHFNYLTPAPIYNLPVDI